MTTTSIKQKLHNYLEVADSKKLKALYTIIEADIEDISSNYTKEFKVKLDERNSRFKTGKAVVVSAKDSQKRIQKIIKFFKTIMAYLYQLLEAAQKNMKILFFGI
jgi:hypothetical protein